MGVPAVELDRVSRLYGAVAAVDEVTLRIEEGEFFSLLGPSGCGKSTTLRMIGGFDVPSRGEVRIRGVGMNDTPPHRRPTNMVFQQLGLFPHLTVFENIAFGLRLAKLERQEIARRVARQLEIVNLAGFEARYPDQLSGGQQQRVAIARALANEPSVLLLDEPLGALDLRLRQKMQVELKDIQRRLNTTFIYVTHDQGEAFAMSDRIGIMNHGRLEQVGTPQAIYRDPVTEFVADFVGETNLLRGRVARIGQGTAFVETLGLAVPLSATGISLGEAVVLSVRPEHVRLCADPQGQAVVRGVIFQGSFVQYALETASGELLTCRMLDGGAQDGPVPGDRVALSFATDRLRRLG
jgi:ABC-type Fe3+/spermidine/putrescine transport system ATPase subunit